MKKKLGRPTDNPKVVRIAARLTLQEDERVEALCKRLGISKSDLTRKALLMAAEQLQAA